MEATKRDEKHGLGQIMDHLRRKKEAVGRGPFFIDFASSINYFQKNRNAFVYGK